MALALKGFGRFWVDYGYDLRRLMQRSLAAWRRQDHRFVWWRAANYVVAGVIVAGIVIPALEIVRVHELYRLNADTVKLAGKTDPKLAGQLEYDEAKQLYQFNKDASAAKDQPVEQLASTVGSPAAKKSLYGVDVAKDMSQGVTYHDANLKVSFSLKPEFAAMDGRARDGRVVFPLKATGGQAVYTLKNNGLKEDIVFESAPADHLRFDYKVDLPRELEARMLPDGSGGVGVYSGDPALYGDITYGSEGDRLRVSNARATSEKTYLVFALPAPVIKAANAKSGSVAKARFELNGPTLSVIADGLKSIDGAFTVDPSVVVTSTGDFQTAGNNESMIDFSTSGQITRGGLTGGSISGGWTSTTSFTQARRHFGSAAYNGYLYVIAGTTGTALSDVQYAPINSNGTIGSWTATTSLATATSGLSAVAYNGYMYVLGGSTGSVINTVQYAPINANGTLGSWVTTSSFTTARDGHQAAVYNGYLYVLGGNDGTNNLSDVQYASINADGSVGTWTATTGLPSTRRNFSTVVYNGYIYTAGGYTTTRSATVQYAPINANGTIGSWTATTSLLTARQLLVVKVYNGYLYSIGGDEPSNPSAATEYAPINANGSIGSWTATSSFTTTRYAHAGAAYNGYLYVFGGVTSGGTNQNDVQYAAFDPAGQVGSFGTLTNNFSTARALTCAVAYNGYLYNIGGSTSDNPNNNVTTVQYTQLNSSTGDSGSWSSTTAMPTTRGAAACVAYNGYLYVGGGYTGSTGTLDTSVVYIAINTNGTLGASWTLSPSVITTSSVQWPKAFVYGTSNGAYLYLVTQGGVVGASLDVSTGAVGAWSSPVTLIHAYSSRSYAQVGKYLYAFGGDTGSAASSAVEYTSINNDGSVNAWTSTTNMNTAIVSPSGTTVNGCMYAVGGENYAGTSQSTVQYACPNANGTISAWYNAPNLTVGTTDTGVTSYNGYIYGVGGWTTSAQTTTQYANVNNGGGGGTGTWSTTTSTAAGHASAKAVVYNGYIYLVNGKSNANTIATTEYAAINADGTLGSWSTTSDPSTVRSFAYVAAYNGYMYAIGGANNVGSSTYNTSEYAAINSNGTLGTWQSTTNLSTGVSAAAGAVYNGYVYIMGGYDGSSVHNDVQYAAINSNGTLGSWSTTTSFTTARSSNSGFAANGYLYVMGGYNASTTYYNDVQYATINSNGTIGSWTYTSPFATPRAAAAVSVSNGFVYLIGGTVDVVNALADVQYAALNSNGTLSRWQATSSLGTGVYNGPSAVYNGYLYAANGNYYSGSIQFSAGVQYTTLGSIARIGRYSKMVDLGNPVSVSGIAYNGTLPMSTTAPGVPSISFRSAGADKTFGSITASTAITAGATSCLATSQNPKRYMLVIVTIDDSGGSMMADATGTLGNVTDFTVNYITPHPTPPIRLKLGRTLQTGNLSPVDTCI